ncbi:MAG: AtpZ/AtpI family protein [Chitinophagaceae bacterium]|nr:AtpZ/AtpI family protein [Chitinophagaceae bacterium]
MDKQRPSPTNHSNKDLLRYAGLGSQLLAAIGLAVFAGLKADKWLHTSPVLACVLPLLALGAMFYKLVRDTGKHKKDEPE